MIVHYATAAVRHFRRHRATTLINVLGLALGLGCFLGAYAVVSYVRQSDGHFANAQRISYVTTQTHLHGIQALGPARTPFITADLLAADFPEFEQVARLSETFKLSASVGGDARSIQVVYADPEFLDIFQFRFMQGDRDALGTPRTAIITDALAARLFGSAPALGRMILLDGKESVKVGAIIESPRQPSHFGTGATAAVRFEALVSMDTHRAMVGAELGEEAAALNFSQFGGRFSYRTYVLSKPGAVLTPAELDRRLAKFATDHVPATLTARVFSMYPITQRLQRHLEGLSGIAQFGVGGDVLMLTLATFVLVISCLNSANLATAVAVTRSREMGVRRLIGGSRRQLIAQLILEAALMTAIALLTALILLLPGVLLIEAAWNIELGWVLLSDLKFWLGLIGLWVIVSCLCAVYPATVLSRLRPVQALHWHRNDSGSRWTPRLLVTLQFGIASGLLVAVLMIHAQNAELRAVGLKNAAATVVITSDLEAANVDVGTFLDRLRAQPHIDSATARFIIPWVGYGATSLAASADAAATRMTVFRNSISYDYFATVGTPLLAGRDFDRRYSEDRMPSADENDVASTVRIILDRSTAVAFGWSNPNEAIGKTLYFPGGRDGGPAQPAQVIGIVEDEMHALTSIGPVSTIHTLSPERAFTPIVRLSGVDRQPGLAEIDKVWREFAPHMALERLFLDEQFEVSFREFEMFTRVLSGLAALAVAIAVAGLIGMTIHVLNRRTHEIGVRKTLGASVGRITTMLLRDFSKPVIIANLIGWPAAYFIAQVYIRGFVQQTDATLSSYVLGLAIMVAIVLAAVIGQSLRAARMHPADVLRYE